MNAMLPPPFRLVERDEVTSTNDTAIELAETGSAAWSVVRARLQTGGRGRRGRVFVSPPGNSYTSFILRPCIAPRDLPQLSLVTGVAVAESIEASAPRTAPVRCKWPNDILINDAKVAGILVETGGDAVIVGIGINLVSHPDIRGVPTTDLASEGAPGVDRDLLLATLCRRLKDRVTDWENSGFASQRLAWLDRAAGIGARASFSEDNSMEGRIVGLAHDGALIMESDGRHIRIVSGTLRLQSATPRWAGDTQDRPRPEARA
ncbi:MAG: biotin--[acetyl-CoA-carboxylase] ligase [bacterium]|nr:biotin--[acetyl-CoA-carboxylase] ligase [bacterium]